MESRSVCCMFSLWNIVFVVFINVSFTHNLQGPAPHSSTRFKRYTQKGCTLPQPLLNGKMTPIKWQCPSQDHSPACQMTPGTRVHHNWGINLECDPGYRLNPSSSISVCVDGVWEPAIPLCEGSLPAASSSTSSSILKKPEIEKLDGECTLPPTLKNGVMSPSKWNCPPQDNSPSCQMTPGINVPHNWVIYLQCDPGYSLKPSSSVSVCVNGLWEPAIPACVASRCSTQEECPGNKACIERRCTDSCESLCGPNTVCEISNHRPLCNCKNGYEGNPYRGCFLEVCGTQSKEGETPNNSEPLILNGNNIKPGEFPWLAAIYQKTRNDKWDQQCGGTLITSHIIVTAAHCLVNNHIENVPLHPGRIRVGLGKYLRSFYASENSSVISEVKEVVVPSQYVGQSSQYARDIGLLDLVTPVQVTPFIMPACVDWFSGFKPDSEAVGVVAGWGKTEEGKSSEVALSARLKFIKYDQCLKKLRVAFRTLLTPDKFCAGNTDGSQVDSGDSGGGLTFLKGGKHFLIGIVSTKVPGESSFSLFLDIAEHRAWIENEQSRLRRSDSGL